MIYLIKGKYKAPEAKHFIAVWGTYEVKQKSLLIARYNNPPIHLKCLTELFCNNLQTAPFLKIFTPATHPKYYSTHSHLYFCISPIYLIVQYASNITGTLTLLQDIFKIISLTNLLFPN